jgi:glycosyltransferase involved in cell wall biosynthesis
MKKICIFCSLSSFGTGMPISTYKLAAGLADRGVDVCVVLPEEGELAERLRGAGVDVGIIPFERLRSDFWKRPWRLLAFAAAGWRLRRYVRGGQVGVVHFSDVIDAPFYPFARIAGAVAVAHIRVCVEAPVVRYLYRVWTHLFCSRIITVSRFVKRYYGFGRKASVVYNPGPDRVVFDPKRYRKASADKNERGAVDTGIVDTDVVNKDDCPTVVAVSSFRRDKGLHNFVEIAAKIAESGRGAARFEIVGGMVPGHESYYYEVMESARRAGLGERLAVTGNVKHEDVAARLAGASVLIHAPDWEEALGGVVLEAMAMGVAAVAYDSGGIGECFRDGVSGYLVGRGDKAVAAARAASLLEKPELREDMAVNAKKDLDAKFTMELYLKGVLAVYDRIWHGK